MEHEVVSTAAPMIGAITAAVAIFWFNIARSRAKEQAARVDMRLRGMEDTLRFILERQRSRRRSRYAEMVRADPVASKLLEEAADREVVELTLAPAYKVGDRVRLIRAPFSGCDAPVGSVGVVSDAWNSGGYDVRFEDIKIMCIASHLEVA